MIWNEISTTPGFVEIYEMQGGLLLCRAVCQEESQ